MKKEVLQIPRDNRLGSSPTRLTLPKLRTANSQALPSDRAYLFPVMQTFYVPGR